MTKPRIAPVRWQPPPSRPLPPPDPTPPITVVAVAGHAPEDVVAAPDGTLFTGTVDGTIVKITPAGQQVVTNTGGRPLGLAVARDGRLLICDSHRGLLRCDTDTGEVETVVADIDGRPLMFCSNVVESSDGTLYFTESTDRFNFEHFMAAVIEARGTGSLFRRSPDGRVSVLASNLHFANGVTLTADESALVFAETTGCRLSKYWLAGPRAGTITPLVSELPGYPDNISTGADGRIWVAMFSERNAANEWLSPRAPLIRKLLWRLPQRWLPKPEPLVWVIGFDPDDGAVLTQFRTHHPAFGLTTGVVETDDGLWLGCLGNPAIAHLNL